MLYQWSGQEEEKLNQILKPLVDACGIVIKPESTRDQALLDTRVQAGTPPDIAFWNVTQLTQYQDKLVAMDKLGGDKANYADFFLTPGTINGKWLGLPVKADIKTIIWYSPVVFEAKGYTVPKTWDELTALVDKMAAAGDVPWSMGFESGDATGWTGTDFVQDLMLVQQGPAYVNDIISGKVKYNDAGVKAAWEAYGKWAKDPKFTPGGAKGTLTTPFLEAIYKPFADPPEAMMVKQSGFAGGEIQKKFPNLKYGTDYDFFAVPGAKGLQGGSDWMMAFKDSPATQALVAYLSSAQGGANWAKASFDLSPNKGAAGNYTDPALIKKGEALANTQGFTPDIGDSIPGGFGSAEFKALTNFINGQDVQPLLDSLAKVQAEALSGASAQPPAASAGAIDCKGAKSGDTISMLYQWSGQEEEKLNQILKPLVDACGIVIKPESTRDQALLDTRVQAGTPPDIAFWNVTQLTQYQDKLVAMDKLGGDKTNYADFFLTPGTINGKWLGLPVKADIKTIIWYSPVVFEAKGYTVPKTWDELTALVDKMAAAGDIPWSMGFESGDATGWTGTDFVQDLMLVQQGPAYVNDIISCQVPYNDAGVKAAWDAYGKWAKDPKYTPGGAKGTLTTPFLEAIYKPFADPPEAMMVKQSGFAGGEIQKKFPNLKYGTDYDFFAVPGAKGLQGGSDWMMAFKDSPATQALVAYLSSAQGGANWAKASFDLSPNKGAAGNYTDPALIKKGEALANTQGFTPDIGDSIPGGFGSAEFKALTNFINGQDVQPLLDSLAQVQKTALKDCK
jgi:alpha-glucoside transport system substrate-binding protein